MEQKLPERVRLVLVWLLENESLLSYSDAVRLSISIKGQSVRGEVTILPDSKK